MYSLQSVPSTPHHEEKQQEELEEEKNLQLQPNPAILGGRRETHARGSMGSDGAGADFVPPTPSTLSRGPGCGHRALSHTHENINPRQGTRIAHLQHPNLTPSLCHRQGEAAPGQRWVPGGGTHPQDGSAPLPWCEQNHQQQAETRRLSACRPRSAFLRRVF